MKLNTIIVEDETDEDAPFDPNKPVKCCICGCVIPWWQSNNPRPLTDNEDDRCCSDCNAIYVLTARRAQHHGRQAFLETGLNFVSVRDEDGISKATDFFFKWFKSVAEDNMGAVYRDILHNGLNRIDPDDQDIKLLWTGYMMGISDEQYNEERRMIKNALLGEDEEE